MTLKTGFANSTTMHTYIEEAETVDTDDDGRDTEDETADLSSL